MTKGDAAMRRKTPRLPSESMGTVVTVSLSKKMNDMRHATSSAMPGFEVHITNSALKAQNRERRLFMVEGVWGWWELKSLILYIIYM